MRKYLIEARVRAGLTQRDAAHKLLISQNYLSDIERNTRQQDLKLSVLKGFSRVYQIPVDELIRAEEACQMKNKED